MGEGTVHLDEDAYEALSALREPGESFSDVVRRLTRSRTRSLAELREAMSEEAAEEVADAVEANRRDRSQRRREKLDPG